MHPSDILLQALIDGELSESRAARALAHLESCGECRYRKLALGRSVDETAELLRSLDRSPPATSVEDVIRMAEGRRLPVRAGEGRSLLRAASLAGLLVAGAVVAAVHPLSPVREAIQRFVRGPGEEAVSPPPVTDPWREAGVALIASAGLEVTFESGQTEGSIELVETGGDTARVEVWSDSVGFVVGEGSVLVRNRGARASYRLAIPSDLPSVRILIGPRTVYEAARGEVLLDEFRQQGSARRLPLSETP